MSDDFCATCGHHIDEHDRRGEDGDCFACDRLADVGQYAPCQGVAPLPCALCGYVPSRDGSTSADNGHDSCCCGLPGHLCAWLDSDGRPCVEHDPAVRAMASLLPSIRLPLPMSSI